MLEVDGTVDGLRGGGKLLGRRGRGPGKVCLLSIKVGKGLEVLELLRDPVGKVVEEFLSKKCVSHTIAQQGRALAGREVQRGTSMACWETQGQSKIMPLGCICSDRSAS